MGTVILVVFVAVVSFAIAGGLTEILLKDSAISRGVVYALAVAVVVALSALAGLGLEVPDQTAQETALRAFVILLPSVLAGVRLALGPKLLKDVSLPSRSR